MNNSYRIIVKTPLLRPGLSIETSVSERYLVAAVGRLMEAVRTINTGKPAKK